MQAYIYDTSCKSFRKGRFSFGKTFLSVSFENYEEEPTQYVIPGLIDVHMHVESSMLSPSGFSKATIPHGTTTILTDCHEISNVAGVDGLKTFMAEKTENSTFYAIPSSVPASSLALETSNASFDADEIKAFKDSPLVRALGEIMNANDLYSENDNRTKRIIQAFRQTFPHYPVEGHCARQTGERLDQFIASGVDSDHTEQTRESFLEKISKGMFLELQYKSFDQEIIKTIVDNPAYDGHYAFCTDDVIADVLMKEGHLDRVLRKAIAMGLSPERAIYAATWAPAVRLRLFDRGWIAPGKRADFIVLSDKDNLTIESVWVEGKKLYDRNLPYSYDVNLTIPMGLDHSIQRSPVKPEDFYLLAPNEDVKIQCPLHQKNSTMTKRHEQTCKAKDGRLVRDDLNILAEIERYGHNSPIVPIPLKNGLQGTAAICTSWAHDSHNLLVVATDEALAAKAVNSVIAKQGGICAIDDTEEIFVPLTYGGIVSVEPFDRLAEGVTKVRAFLKRHGYEATDEIMSLAVLGLPASPELKVTDKGMVDTKLGEIVDWRIG